jgi:preprotein translocase subunit YajC
MFISEAFAQDGIAQAAAGAPMDIIFMIGFVVVIYLFVLRPQNKRFKEHQALIAGVSKGDKVITDSGLHGTIKKVSDDNGTIDLEIADGVVVKIVRQSVAAMATVEDTKSKKEQKK